MTTKAGQLIEDGDAVWILDDIRDGARVGDIIMRPTLRDGYIKANGATVKASEYPRLLAWVQESNMTVTTEQYTQDCSKYVYDATQDRLTMPNATGRVLMGGESVKSVEAGLPNITGEFQWGKGVEGLGYRKGALDTLGFAARGDGGHMNTVSNLLGFKLDASKSSPIYGRSNTVQPPALSLIAQIKY